ncbi:ectonucleoside triphosphate diphosphohydrolase 5 [Salpingoeca rosetta]|uniref:Ectonucleoside triphosphate diphosphohydrolase 5 n=1 Tax=Salpingoeca rosetta (strain ATCC 50818 / BSB-021) TaxID=946362 RepID=F2UDE5_SALR5|nr:ectonucleoside triphosphate diphosphohydrolase 5 [Salpingoeca rosetta]EGD74640.1 ectonucleoside triphosphate diphosphohydrolase 5 [Salpingoeca rosetta]|eukprot:XP_004992897.1 ectonucleoside triphosphate diphosphohydrolase 5 [Salpingoeca rosetta]
MKASRIVSTSQCQSPDVDLAQAHSHVAPIKSNAKRSATASAPAQSTTTAITSPRRRISATATATSAVPRASTDTDTMPPSKFQKYNIAGSSKSIFPLRILGAIVLIVLLVYLLEESRFTAPSDYYGIMMDAGSTGSRIHVFHFESNDPSSGHMVLKSEVFHALKPGLSSFADDPRAGAQSLVPLLELAMSTVPEQARAITPINLKATAGLRLLRPEQSKALLMEVETLLQSYPFLYDPEDAVEIMSGLDEGMFAWVTVNYLLESIALDAQHTCVVLDLGGGSTQIALASPEASPELRKSTTMGAEHHMFLYSHLGYGLMAGRGQMFGFEFKEGDTHVTGTSTIQSPCIPHDETLVYTYNDRKYRVTGATSVSAGDCMQRARHVIADPNGSFVRAPQQPPISKHQPIFAMSYYFDRAQDVGILGPDAEQGSLSIQHYKDVAERVCGMSTSELRSTFPNVSSEDAPYLCTDLCFISALLEHGFGIHDEQRIILARKLFYNGAAIETQWPLGAGLEELFEELEKLR